MKESNDRDPNDNTATRFMAVLVILLIIVAAVAVIESMFFMYLSDQSHGSSNNSPIGAGLCLIAAAIALGSGIFAIIKLIKD